MHAAAARKLEPGAESPRSALGVLLGGPTSKEKAARFFSNFGAATRDLPFTVRIRKADGLAVVGLNRSIMKVRFMFVSVQDVAQITSTVGQFPMVDRVEIRVGGRPLCRVLGEC